MDKQNCKQCKYFIIYPPIIETPFGCKLGAKKMPHWTVADYTCADDCPMKKEKDNG